MTHQLHEYDGEEQRPHGSGVISVIMHWSDKFGDILTILLRRDEILLQSSADVNIQDYQDGEGENTC